MGESDDTNDDIRYIRWSLNNFGPGTHTDTGRARRHVLAEVIGVTVNDQDQHNNK